MRNETIVAGETYHICNRATEGRKIFYDDNEKKYFLETLLLVNSTDKRDITWRRELLRSSKHNQYDIGDPIIEIYAIILMPDHFHILCKQLKNNGVASIMQRSCNSLGKYYNQKHKRKGALFMGRYKAVRMASERQAGHILTYIHGNALDLIDLKWRRGEINQWLRAEKFLKEYQWSSLGIYAKTKTSPLMQKLTYKRQLGYINNDGYLKEIRSWANRNKNEYEFDDDILLD